MNATRYSRPDEELLRKDDDMKVSVQVRLDASDVMGVDSAVIELNDRADPGQPPWTRSSYVASAVIDKLALCGCDISPFPHARSRDCEAPEAAL